MICTDKLPKFCIEGVKLYLKELEHKKQAKVQERNNIIDRYSRFCKNSFEYLTENKRVVEIDKDDLTTLSKIIKEYYYNEYEQSFTEINNEIALVKRWIEKEEAQLQEDDD